MIISIVTMYTGLEMRGLTTFLAPFTIEVLVPKIGQISVPGLYA